MLAYFNIGAHELPADLEQMGVDELREALWALVDARYSEREARHAPEVMREFERAIMLHAVDVSWKDHLLALDHLKEGIGLRGYGQRDPLNEYKRESYELFQAMKDRVEGEIVSYLWRLRPVPADEARPVPAAAQAPRAAARQQPPLVLNNPSSAPGPFGGASPAFGSATATASPVRSRAPQPARVGGDDAEVKTVRREEPKVGRNDPCPCGSGKKYKKCHGAAA